MTLMAATTLPTSRAVKLTKGNAFAGGGSHRAEPTAASATEIADSHSTPSSKRRKQRRQQNNIGIQVDAARGEHPLTSKASNAGYNNISAAQSRYGTFNEFYRKKLRSISVDYRKMWHLFFMMSCPYFGPFEGIWEPPSTEDGEVQHLERDHQFAINPVGERRKPEDAAALKERNKYSRDYVSCVH